jgi:hypothetical protein
MFSNNCFSRNCCAWFETKKETNQLCDLCNKKIKHIDKQFHPSGCKHTYHLQCFKEIQHISILGCIKCLDQDMVYIEKYNPSNTTPNTIPNTTPNTTPNTIPNTTPSPEINKVVKTKTIVFE